MTCTPLQGPLKAFVDALGPLLRERISPGIEYESRTNRSISPIHNDRRSRPEATPYWDHVLLTFPDFCAEELARAARVHRWLTRELEGAPTG